MLYAVKIVITHFVANIADIRTLIRLKCVDREWQRLALNMIDSITCIDALRLHRTGCLWQVPLAVRELPHLHELRWDHFVVNLVTLRTPKDDEKETKDEDERLLLTNALKATLLKHITRERDETPPVELLLAAASAVSGSLGRMPVEDMRNNRCESIHLFDVGPQYAMLIGLLLPVTNSLTSLNFSRGYRNDIGSEGAKSFADALRVNGSLTSLDLSANGLCGVWTEEDDEGEGVTMGTYTAKGIKALADALCVNSSLTSLNLFDNAIGAEGAKAIADALRVNGSLTKLDARHNDIEGDGAQQLSAAVLANDKIEVFNEIPIKELRADALTELILSNKGIGDDGAMVVAGLMPVSGSLTSLNLVSNAIGAEGAKAIADALRVNGSLTSLDLSYNGIGDEGAKAVGESLRVNGSLTSLNLQFNDIGPEGAKTLGEALTVNGSLTSLNLSCKLWDVDEDSEGTYTTEGIKTRSPESPD